ncbi:inner centromere protein B isoform X2 [Hippoglossus hippoglossus]|uniref:inner centromere protein B isoform X2 n=1 Tax=Hippoglossus hippoglossus TaxID=8267 RepID=UPI00148BE07A|nr:inner centromere protein B isoform X2 [Hippoglossus hippoglossus]
MNTLLTSVRSLMQMFDGKKQEFINDIDNVHVVWLEEIQQEAKRMFSRDFNAEPELMPKTPSQKKNSRRKRVSLGRQEENQAKRRFSKGKRSNLRGSSVKSLNFIVEEEPIPGPSTSEASTSAQPKRTTRKNKQSKPEVAEDVSHSPSGSDKTEEVQNKKPELLGEEDVDTHNKGNNAEVEPEDMCSIAQSPPKIPLPEVVVNISSAERLSAELAKNPERSPGRTAAKIEIAGAAQSSRRSSVRCSLKLRHSLAGLRHSLTQESIRRASRRSMLKRKAAHQGNSTCSSDISEDSCMDSDKEEDKEAMLEAVTADTVDNAAAEGAKEAPQNQTLYPSVARITRSVAAHSPTLAPPALFTSEHKVTTPEKRTVIAEKHRTPQSARRSRLSIKRKAPDTVEESPTKRFSPPKKSQSAVRPNMRSFLHTVQKNQMLMMTPNSLGRTAVIKSFIKHTTPMRADPKLSVGLVAKERHKLEALKKKQEQEEERMKKMEEDKRRKLDELKRKRDERLRRVFDAKVKEEQREEEKKKKFEQKMAQIDEMKNDKRVADEKAKKKVVLKRQEEVEQKKKLEEEARRKKIQQAEEEKRQQELAKKKAEEEEQRVRKLAEARKALELKREQERERELERERQAATERERAEKEKALALQRELERAAREKERRELDEKRKALEEKRKREEEQRLAAEQKAAKEREAAKQREAAAKQAAKVQATAASGLNVTVDIENSVMRTPVGKGGGLNVTMDVEQSPQSYSITPKGGNKPLTLSKTAEDYGMDQNSDDSTDDESAPRKPIPSWAEGPNLQQIIMKQYFNPPDLDSFFGKIEPPKLENIFYKSKPRYFKRTSSAVWHSPPVGE